MWCVCGVCESGGGVVVQKQPMMKIKLLFTESQSYRRNRAELNSRALHFTGYPRGVSALSVIRYYLFQQEPTHFHFETTFCGYGIKNKD